MVYNLVSPMHSQNLGRNSAKSNKDVEGIGESKKQTILCNALCRGLFALIRKDADLLYGVLLCE